MANHSQATLLCPPALDPILPYPKGTPVLYEDDEEPEMGESNAHAVLDRILSTGLMSHLKPWPEYQMFANMNLYYSVEGNEDEKHLPYASPDIMIVRPYVRLSEELTSYRIRREGPVPVVALEILSPGTARDVDLIEKVELYRTMGVREYILVDSSADLLPQRLLLKRLRANGTWEDCQDSDGGVTSLLGFRLLFDEQDTMSVVNSQTGNRYRRPDEAEAEAEARLKAEEAREFEADLRRQAVLRAIDADYARKLAEADQKAEAEARKQAEEARKQAEADRKAEAQARKQAEEARKQAEADREAEAEARKQAEAAQRLAEQRLRELEEELKRLRGQPAEEE